MYPPHALDLSWHDIMAGLRFSYAWRGGDAAGKWHLGNAPALAILSVRTGFDLFLQAAALPAGAEIVVSAITHPDMVEILRHHGLIPIPADLHFDTAAPTLATIRGATSPRTRGVLFTHLFGAVANVEPLVTLAKHEGWLFIEDCAQLFGTGYWGHEDADIALFSFGPLKTATALGGALLRTRDPELLARIAAIEATYPLQRASAFRKRLRHYGLRHFLSRPRRYDLVYWVLRRLGRDPGAAMLAATRDFGDALAIERLRLRPCRALLRLLRLRLDSQDALHVRRRARIGHQLAEALAGIDRPGAAGMRHTHWIFPVTVADRDAAIEALAAAGFHATPGLSNLAVVEPPPDRPHLEPRIARAMLANSLLVPQLLRQFDVPRVAAALGRQTAPVPLR